MQTRNPRVAIAGILHESNTFFQRATKLDDFDIQRAGEIAAVHAASASEIAGFLEGASSCGFDAVPLMVAWATPGGPVEGWAFQALTVELVDMLKAQAGLDGLLLALHGAMVCEDFPHADAEITRRVREAMGAGFPIVVTHDFHANVAPEIIDHADVLLGYKTNPHIDQRERGVKAAWILHRMLTGQARPAQAIAKPPMLYNIRFQNTNREPLQPIVEETRRLETDARFLGVSVLGGYQYADTPSMGVSVVVATDNDADLARAEADRLGQMLWATRDRLRLDLPEAAAAVAQACASDEFPVVLVDMGDNIGGGSAGDSTFLLAELLRQNAQGWVMVLADPDAVTQAVHAGIGGRFEGLVGGKTDSLHGESQRVSGRVKMIHDGKFIETEVRHGGARYYDQGLSALIEVDGGTRDTSNLLLLTSNRQPPLSLHQLLSCGIDAQRQKILVVKAAIAFRAAYEPIAARILEVDTPGATAVNPARFTYRHADVILKSSPA